MDERKLRSCIGLVGVAALAGCQGGGNFDAPVSQTLLPQAVIYALSFGVGLAVGAGLSDRFSRERRLVFLGLGALFVLVSLLVPSGPLRAFMSVPVVLVLFGIAVGIGLTWGRIAPDLDPSRSKTFGSAAWMSLQGLLRSPLRLVGQEGLILGWFMDGETPLQYVGERHLLTVAPTRAGKGTAAIIPNLLTYTGSALVIDPKGENALITADRRKSMGQTVHVVDPWGITGMKSSGFNPLIWMTDPANTEIGENALMLADALVPESAGGESFWNDEARSLIMGIALHVATSPAETDRTLGRVRDLLNLSTQEFDDLTLAMAESAHPIVAATGRRTASKHERLKSSMLAVAQSHTHFLDSPSLRENLAQASFRFEDLKERPTTIYLVLPSDRLHTFGRWLRLLIQQAITINARNIAVKPPRPILFMLDEMASLGRLTMVQQAYGLMAGFGMQLWAIVQDLSQLQTIYGEGWQTFVANSGVLQYFGSRDKATADYFSDLVGSETVRTLSSTFSATTSPGGGSQSTGHSHGETARKLIMPDELMRLRDGVQLLLVENANPIDGRKREWYSDPELMKLGKNLRR